jgi:hypothetical protein
MGWKVLREEHPHFVVQGNGGEFKIHSESLSSAAVTRMRAMCRGGKVEKPMAEGGEVEEDAKPVPLGEAHDSMPKPPSGTGSTFGPKYDWLEQSRAVDPKVAASFERRTHSTVNPTGVQGAETPTELPAAPGAADAQPAGDALNISESPPGAETPDLLKRPPEASAGAMGQPPPLPPMPPEADWQRAQAQLTSSLKEGQAGAETQARAETEKQLGLADAYQQHQTQLQKMEDQRVSDTKNAQMQIDRVIQDIEGTKIDPRHFWDSKSIGSKAMAGIGMILSGIGAGLTHGPNLAVQFIQKQVDQDIEAQKANLGKKENLLGYMFKKYGNIQDAAVATRAYLTATLAGQVGLAGARAGSQQALAASQILKSQLGMQALGIQDQIIQGRHQDALQRYQLNFQRWAMQNYGSAAGEPGFVPSGTNPPIPSEVSLKGFSELNKAQGEMRVNLPELGPNAHTYAPPEVARDVNKALPHFANMERDLRVIEQLGKQHAWGINAPFPNQAKKQFQVAANELRLSLNQLLQQQRFTQPEDVHYGEMVTKPMEFLWGKTGASGVVAMRQAVQAHRLAEYQRLGIKMAPRPKETPLSKEE